LSTLEQEGLVQRDPDTARYRIAIALFQLGGVALANVTIRSAAASVLSDLSRQSGDTVCLMIEHGSDALCIDRFDGDFPIQQTALTMGKTMALHVGGGPFALLSHLPLKRREEFLQKPLQSFTPSTVVDPDKIRKRIERVREVGFAVGDEDAIAYLVAIGVPIFGYEGRLIGALSVGGLKQRYPKSRIAEVAKLAVSAGAEISSRFGRTLPSSDLRSA
jgi:DNA-binding IclR family transcriptional regulator